jgi:hypothetical protein
VAIIIRAWWNEKKKSDWGVDKELAKISLRNAGAG